MTASLNDNEGGEEGEGGGDGGEGNVYDPANLAATFFALAGLMVLGDGMGGVRRRECLGWLRGLQRGDGSFGEGRGRGGVVGGGDVRFAYLAAGVRWMLRRGGEGDVDVDVEGLVGWLGRCVVSFLGFFYGVGGLNWFGQGKGLRGGTGG